MQTQFINEKAIVENWGPMLQKSLQVQDRQKLAWMSLVAENQRKNEAGALNESLYGQPHGFPNPNINGMNAVTFPGNPGLMTNFGSQTPGSGDRPFSLLPLAMQVAAQTIALDLVPVVPMPGPLGMLTYMDFVYAGGRTDSKEAPLIIKAPLTITDGVTVLTAGTTYFMRLSAVNHFAFTYIAKSTIDGYPIFKVVATDSTGTLRAIGAAADVTLASAITTDSLYAAVSGGTAIGTFGTAQLVKALEDHIPGFSTRAMTLGDGVTNDLEGYLREEGELNQENMMGLTLRSQSVEAQTIQVAAAATREQIDDLRQYGIDAMAQLEAILTNELTQTINKMILSRMFRMGATTHTRWFASSGENFNLNFASTDKAVSVGVGMDGNATPTMLTRKINQFGGETITTWQNRIMVMMLASAQAINNHTKRGAGNFAVTNYVVGVALQAVSGFTAAPMANTINQAASSLYQVGSVAGIAVYIDPNMGPNDTRIFVGRKGDSSSTGLVFMPYLLSQSTQIIHPDTMAPKIAIKSRFALVEAGHRPWENYVVFKVENGDLTTSILGN